MQTCLPNAVSFVLECMIYLTYVSSAVDEHTGGVNSVKCVTVLKIPASVSPKLAVLGEPKCCCSESCHKRSTICSEKLKRRTIESGTVEMSILARASKSSPSS